MAAASWSSRFGQSRAAVGTDRFDQADPQRLPQHRDRRPQRLRQRSLAGVSSRRRQVCRRTCRCPQACAARLGRTACREASPAGSSPSAASSATPRRQRPHRYRPRRVQVQLGCGESHPVGAVPDLSGGNRITLMAQVEAPDEAGGDLAIQDRRRHGGAGHAPAIAGDALILNRIAVSGSYDPTKRRFVVEQGDHRQRATSASPCPAMRIIPTASSRLNAGFAGTRMPVDTLKRLWPVFVVAQGARLVQ